jgi:type I restriction enzyme S subunit
MQPSWQTTKLRHVAEYVNGFAFGPSDWGAEGDPIIRIQNLNEPSKPYNCFAGKIDDKYRVHAGDILISWSASLGVYIWEGQDAWLNQHIFKVSLKEDVVDRTFFYYLITSKIAKIAGLTRGSTMKHVTRKTFLDVDMPLPPLYEQQAIAHVLKSAQLVKDLLTREIGLERERKATLMRQLFTYGNRREVTKQTKIGEMPASWKLLRLAQLCSRITDGAHRTPTYVVEGVPFLRVADIHSEKIDWSNVKRIPEEEHRELIKRCKPEFGDILLSKNGTIGKTKLIDWNTEFSTFVSLCLLKPKRDLINNVFLTEFLASNGLPQILKRGKKMTVTNLHLVEIKELLIPLPSLEEQNEIAGILEASQAKINVLLRETALIEELLKTLLDDLMSGRLSSAPLREMEVKDE